MIVARSYLAINIALGGRERGADTIVDVDGHGTSVAAIAAGGAHQTSAGVVSGVAPKAWLGIYNLGDSGWPGWFQALDDALGDEMDILNLSWFMRSPGNPAYDPTYKAISRLTEEGMLLVMAAGNGGPARRTLSTVAVHPHVITVGASPSSSVIGGSVAAGGGAPLEAFPMLTPNPVTLEGALFDLRQLDAAATACRAYPADSLRERIVLTANGGCPFEAKLNNLMAAGARAMVLYLTAPGAAGRATAGAATLPAVMVNQPDGQALLSRLSAQSDLRAVIVFDGVAHTRSAAGISGFSSRGPTLVGVGPIKPDLLAVGQHFTATRRTLAPNGYVNVNATSFSTPMVSGAAAVLKAARPSLTLHQLRSLLVNTARVISNDAGVAPVQEAGAGGLNLNAALEGTVALLPTSIGLGMGQISTGWSVYPLQVTNLTDKPETYRMEAVHFGGSAARDMRVRLNPEWAWPFPNQTAINVTLAAGQSRTIQVYIEGDNTEPGEHQGFIQVTGSQTGLTYNVPYWLGIGDNIPATSRYFGWVGRNGSAENFPNQEVFLRFEVGDRLGIQVARDSLNFRGSVVSGGGEVLGLDNSVIEYGDHAVVRVRLGPQPGNNVYRIEWGRISGTIGVPSVPRP